MDAVRSFFAWIGTNEQVLSGIAAAFVILGVLYAPLRRLASGRRRGAAAPEPLTVGVPPAAERPPLVSDRPSIAVLPFSNGSGDPEQEFLADGLTEDIITGLSRVKQLFVIARNTSFTYKGRTLDAQHVSRDLGVRYVLEGSVRRAGERVRVSAQLVDAPSRRQVWGERFDRPLREILQVDDEVTDAIVGALLPALRRAEAEHARRAAPEDLTAWGLVNRAWVSVQSDLGNVDTAKQAIRACEEALALDPDYAFGHAVLAHARSLLVHQPAPEGQADAALASIERALALDPDDPFVHHCHAALLGNLGRTDAGIRAWERAIELNPNNAGARAGLGIARIYRGEAEAALPAIDAAIRLSPRDPLGYHWIGSRALALALLGRVEEAEEAARDSLQRRASRLGFTVLAGVLAQRDRPDEAGAAFAELQRRFPNLDAEGLARMADSLAPDPAQGRALGAALRLAAARAESARAGA